MMKMSVQRIKAELAAFKRQEKKSEDIQLEFCENQINKLVGMIKGPPDTPYAGGWYELSIEIPDTYPYTPPKVKFVTRVWHPNVSSVTGAICLDILSTAWSAALRIDKVLLSIQVLLSCPEPDDPQDAVVAKQYKNDFKLFNDTAREWVVKYASANPVKSIG